MIQVQQKSQSKQDNSASIQGKIKINNILFNTICDCSGGEGAQQTQSLCNPTKIKIQKNKDGKGASFDAVRNMIGQPSELTFVNIGDHHFSCLDGRINKPILGTPGGDAGEFILALHVYEGMLGFNRKLTEESVQQYLETYLKTMRQPKFYMCTDDYAVEHIEKDSGITMNMEILRNPQPANQEQVLDLLQKSDNIGCPHLKKMVRNPEYYSIRVDIVKMFIKAFYKTLWDKSNPLREKLILDSLAGQQKETAFLEVRSNQACNTAQIAPLIRPNSIGSDQLSIFINHLDGASIRRHQLAKFFETEINKHQDPFDAEIMHHRMNKHGLAFLEVTGAYMAKNLPFYTLNLV